MSAPEAVSVPAADTVFGRSAAATPTAPIRRTLTVVRLVHPFPSLLDGAVVAVVALVAGGAPGLAATLGISMTLLQFAIGSLNDVMDATRDAGRATKPVAVGLVSRRRAQGVAATSAAVGLLLALAGGPGLLLLALVVLGVGALYDLLLKGTPLSWLPLALGVPLLPVYGWYGAVGTLPGAFGVLVPAAALGGTALAIANAAVDIERDRAAGVTSLAVALGPRGAALAGLVVQLGVAALAVGSAGQLGATGTWLLVASAAAAVPVAGAAFGLVVAGRGPGGREVAFEVQAVGLALLAVAWVSATGVGAR